MDKDKIRRLAKRGWTVGDAKDFLGLSDDELAYIEIKLAFARSLRTRRTRRRMTQVELAEMMKSSQSRIAKMEAGDPTVSLDLLIRGLLALGATPKELAQVMTVPGLLVSMGRT